MPGVRRRQAHRGTRPGDGKHPQHPQHPPRNRPGLGYRRQVPTSPDLAALPPATRTDLELLQLEGSVIKQREGCLVVRSPLQPGFHWGNCLHITTGDVEDAGQWTAVFSDEFPEADWLAVGLHRMPVTDSWQQLGLEPESEDALIRRGAPGARPLPRGYTVRAFDGQADWDQLFEADLDERAADVGQADGAYRAFARERERSRQGLVEQGRLAWFGAFDTAGALACSMGIAVLGEERRLARYQSVLTSPDHRRKGLAGHLLGVAAGWAEQQGAREYVIVTEPSNPAGRLYRSVGFEPTLSCASVYRAPQG